MKKWLQVLLIYWLIPAVGLILAVGAVARIPLIFLDLNVNEWFFVCFVPIVTVFAYVLLRKKLDLPFAARVNAGILIILSVSLAVILAITSGSTNGKEFSIFTMLTFPFLLLSLLMMVADSALALFACIFATYAAAMITCLVLSSCGGANEPDRVQQPPIRRLLPYLLTVAVVLLCGTFSVKQYQNRPEVRYAGHGFSYMHGYSSTDFTDYMVYSENSKLVELDHQPSFTIEDEKEMPVMDGAEACYPVYAAVAKAVYQGIEGIEMAALQTDYEYTNGKIVCFTNTVRGFSRLLDKEVNLLFGATPSKEQLAEAAKKGIALTITPIGREAFVFFVEKDNPIDNLTSQQIRAIYHGEVTNWKELGGKNQEIRAFQRPQNSGSQAVMEYFMGDVSLMEPDKYSVISAMEGTIEKVAQYADEDGAMGYSFRYFVEELNQEDGVKILCVDGVAPTLENIENGLYPLTVDLCLITRAYDPKANVQKMIDFMLSPDGQEIIRRTGYATLKRNE